MSQLVSGSPCTVNKRGDVGLMADARPFLGSPCVIVKRMESGLIQVALVSDPKKTYAFPERNVDLIFNPKQGVTK